MDDSLISRTEHYKELLKFMKMKEDLYQYHNIKFSSVLYKNLEELEIKWIKYVEERERRYAK